MMPQKPLICTQLEFKSQADMLDLESAIRETAMEVTNLSEHIEIEDVNTSKKKKTLHDSTAQTAEIENDIWPPKVDQYIYGLFEDGVFPGEVKSVDKEYVEIDILVRATIPNMNSDESLWKKPSMSTNSRYKLHRNSVLPFYPLTVINPYSTHRVTIFQLLNYDIAEKFF